MRAHFEWNRHRPELAADRVDGKHFSMAERSLLRGGRQDIFLGTRDCQGYVGPCRFGEDASDYWHRAFAWPQNFGEDRHFTGVPAPRDIAEAAYGRRVDEN